MDKDSDPRKSNRLSTVEGYTYYVENVGEFTDIRFLKT